MAGPHAPPHVCAHADCPGARLEGEHCIEHLTPGELDNAATRLRDGELLDARNTRISTERLRSLLDALRIDNKLVLHAASFRWAAFSGNASFAGATFSSVSRHYRGSKLLRVQARQPPGRHNGRGYHGCNRLSPTSLGRPTHSRRSVQSRHAEFVRASMGGRRGGPYLGCITTGEPVRRRWRTTRQRFDRQAIATGLRTGRDRFILPVPAGPRRKRQTRALHSA
jgi:hypothetical protein